MINSIKFYDKFSNSNEIDPTEIKFEKEIGEGSYGLVFKAKWRGSDISVKKLKENSNFKEIESFRSETLLISKYYEIKSVY